MSGSAMDDVQVRSSGSPGETDPQASGVKPSLRGWIHAGFTPVVLAAGIVLCALSDSSAERLAAAVYATAGFALFATSAVYHTGTWSLRAEKLLRRADHTNIYLMTAGSYTPIAVAGLPDLPGRSVVLFVWAGAAAGVFILLRWPRAPRAIGTGIYVALGWSIVPVLPALFATSTSAAVLVVTGGALYTLGGCAYAARWPDPRPRMFGFHEVFHLFTIAAWTCQYIGIVILFVS